MAQFVRSCQQKKIMLTGNYCSAVIELVTTKQRQQQEAKIALQTFWRETNGKIVEIARLTGWSRPTVLRKAKRFGLYKPLRRA